MAFFVEKKKVQQISMFDCTVLLHDLKGKRASGKCHVFDQFKCITARTGEVQINETNLICKPVKSYKAFKAKLVKVVSS